jgi:hypothetical protein
MKEFVSGIIIRPSMSKSLGTPHESKALLKASRREPTVALIIVDEVWDAHLHGIVQIHEAKNSP